MRKALLALAVVFVAFGTPGCVDDAKTEEAKKTLISLSGEIKELDKELEKLQEQMRTSGVEQLEAISAKIDSKKRIREQLVSSATNLEHELSQGGDLFVAGVKTAAPWMGQYGPLAVFAATLLSGIFAGIERHKSGKKKEAEMKRKLIAAHNNIDSVIADPELGGAGKFDASDPATIARLKDLDREAGITAIMAEANQ